MDQLGIVESESERRRRAIETPLEVLPSLGEQQTEIDAPADRAWSALFPALEGALDTNLARSHSEHAGAIETDAHGDLHRPGGALPNFVVTRAIEPVMLVLVGEHRFARYALICRVDLLPEQRCQLRLETRAEFDGARGRLYALALRGSGGRGRIIGRVLRETKRRSESTGR